jgi:hypothetical protein
MGSKRSKLFKAINVIVGDNASGKTSLLEALFLSQVGQPEIITRLRLWRGLGPFIQIARSRGAYEALWKDLFYNGLEDRHIEISTAGTPENARSLEIFYNPNEPFAIASPSAVIGSQKSDSSIIMPLTFSSKSQDGTETRICKPLITSEGLNWGGLAPPSLVAFFSSSFAAVVGPNETAIQFSELSKRRKEKRVIKVMRTVYPRIKSLSVETEMGQSMLFADIKGLPIKMPLAFFSGGSHKLVALLLGISSHATDLMAADKQNRDGPKESKGAGLRALLAGSESTRGMTNTVKGRVANGRRGRAVAIGVALRP